MLRGILTLCFWTGILLSLLTVVFGTDMIVEIPDRRITQNTGKRSVREMLNMTAQ